MPGRGGQQQQQPKQPKAKKVKEVPNSPPKPWRPLNEQEVIDGSRHAQNAPLYSPVQPQDRLILHFGQRRKGHLAKVGGRGVSHPCKILRLLPYVTRCL